VEAGAGAAEAATTMTMTTTLMRKLGVVWLEVAPGNFLGLGLDSAVAETRHQS
jgi:hypothetical protein